MGSERSCHTLWIQQIKSFPDGPPNHYYLVNIVVYRLFFGGRAMLRTHRKSGIMHLVNVTIASRMAPMQSTISVTHVNISTGELRPSNQARGSRLATRLSTPRSLQPAQSARPGCHWFATLYSWSEKRLSSKRRSGCPTRKPWNDGDRISLIQSSAH